MNAVLKEAEYRELLLGSGNNPKKEITFKEVPQDWQNLTKLDIDPDCKPDVIHDLNVLPYPFPDNSFNEIHAYDVLEHTGQQGDWRFFFAQFDELWRILKPGGFICGACPMWDSPWSWSDPGHSRVLSKLSLIFLDRRNYADIGKTPMTDYRHIYKGDFEVCATTENEHKWGFVLKAVK